MPKAYRVLHDAQISHIAGGVAMNQARHNFRSGPAVDIVFLKPHGFQGAGGYLGDQIQDVRSAKLRETRLLLHGVGQSEWKPRIGGRAHAFPSPNIGTRTRVGR